MPVPLDGGHGARDSSAIDLNFEERPVPAQRNGFRKREIAFALGMGALAAGGAAATLAALHDGDRIEGPAAAKESRNYQLAPFEQIFVSGSQDVEVSYGNTIAVRAEGSKAALDQLEIAVDKGKLSIRPKSGLFGGDWDLFDDVTVHVTLPELKQFELAGSNDVRIDRIEGKSFAGIVNGSGALAIDALKVGHASFDLAGSGDLSASGTADDTKVTLSGSGDIHADGFVSKAASVSVIGSGSVALAVDRSAEVSMIGSGNVDISGPGRCSVTQIGSGKVRCDGDEGGDKDADD